MARMHRARIARHSILGLSFLILPVLGWAGCGGGGSTTGPGGGSSGSSSSSGSTNPCGEGATLCGSACTVTSIDPNNCGACDKKCDPGQVCAAGMCALSC